MIDSVEAVWVGQEVRDEEKVKHPGDFQNKENASFSTDQFRPCKEPVVSKYICLKTNLQYTICQLDISLEIVELHIEEAHKTKMWMILIQDEIF